MFIDKDLKFINGGDMGMDELTKAALERAKRTAIEYICSSMPVGLVVTPAMLQNFDFNTIKWIILAWLATGVIQVAAAFFAGLKTGLPEAQPAIEATEEDVSDEPPVKYPDEDNYDDLKVEEDEEDSDEEDDSEDTDEGEYDDDDLEQK